MDKHLSIAIMQAKRGVIQVLNESGLPGCVLQLVMENVMGAVRELAEQEYQMDLEEAQKEAQMAQRKEEGRDDSDDTEQARAEEEL